MAVQQQMYTAEAFWEMVRAGELGDKRYELIEGVITEMAPSSPTNSRIAMRIGAMLLSFVDAHNLGYVFGADGGYTLTPGIVRIPDVSFVSIVRLPQLPEIIEGGPDLAVEVISPSETPRSLMDKVKLYINAGTLMVWAVYPEDNVVDVYQPGEAGVNVQTFDRNGVLEGGEVLPGFSLPVQKIFA